MHKGLDTVEVKAECVHPLTTKTTTHFLSTAAFQSASYNAFKMCKYCFLTVHRTSDCQYCGAPIFIKTHPT